MRRRADVIWREVEGQVVGLDLRSSQYFSLNSTAATLWDLLADDVDRDELVRALVSAHDIDPVRAEADVDQFTQCLRDNGLVDG